MGETQEKQRLAVWPPTDREQIDYWADRVRLLSIGVLLALINFWLIVGAIHINLVIIAYGVIFYATSELWEIRPFRPLIVIASVLAGLELLLIISLMLDSPYRISIWAWINVAILLIFTRLQPDEEPLNQAKPFQKLAWSNGVLYLVIWMFMVVQAALIMNGAESAGSSVLFSWYSFWIHLFGYSFYFPTVLSFSAVILTGIYGLVLWSKMKRSSNLVYQRADDKGELMS